jgi:hypothetical protein
MPYCGFAALHRALLLATRCRSMADIPFVNYRHIFGTEE